MKLNISPLVKNLISIMVTLFVLFIIFVYPLIQIYKYGIIGYGHNIAEIKHKRVEFVNQLLHLNL